MQTIMRRTAQNKTHMSDVAQWAPLMLLGMLCLQCECSSFNKSIMSTGAIWNTFAMGICDSYHCTSVAHPKRSHLSKASCLHKELFTRGPKHFTHHSPGLRFAFSLGVLRTTCVWRVMLQTHVHQDDYLCFSFLASLWPCINPCNSKVQATHVARQFPARGHLTDLIAKQM